MIINLNCISIHSQYAIHLDTDRDYSEVMGPTRIYRSERFLSGYSDNRATKLTS